MTAEQQRAYSAVARAKAAGTLIPEPCEVCRDPQTEAHHRDGYADPLRVVWLCKRHHGAEHQSGVRGPSSWADLRLARNLSVAELAARSGVPRSVVGFIDQGRLTPSPTQAAAILAVLSGPETA